MVAVAITSNARFKQGYTRHLRYAFFVAVSIHLLLFYFSPPFDFKPYIIFEGPPTTEIVYPPEIELPPLPDEVARPLKEIIPSDDGEDVDDVDIPPNVYPKFPKVLIPAAEEQEKVQEFYPFDEPPALIRAVSPMYPELMRQAGIEGTVDLLVLVGEDGTVLRVSVLQSDVTPAMERAAIAAAKQFLFRPAKQGVFSVKAQMKVPIVFKLR